MGWGRKKTIGGKEGRVGWERPEQEVLEFI